VDYVLDTATGSTNSSTAAAAVASNHHSNHNTTATFMPTSLNDLLQAQEEEEKIRHHNDHEEEGIEPPPPASRTAATASSSSSCQAAAPLFHPLLNEATEEIEEFVREHSQKLTDLWCASPSSTSKNPGSSSSVWTTALQQKWEFFVVLQRHHKLWKHQLVHHQMVQQTQAEIALFVKEHHALLLSFIYDDETVAADTADTTNENVKGKGEGEAASQPQHTKKKKKKTKKKPQERPGRIGSTGSNSTTRTSNSRRSGISNKNVYTPVSIL